MERRRRGNKTGEDVGFGGCLMLAGAMFLIAFILLVWAWYLSQEAANW